MINKYAHITGGADRNVLALARELEIAGHRVALLSTKAAHNEFTGGAFVPPGVTHSNRTTLSVRDRVAVAARALWNPVAADATRRLLSDFKPDVVHAHKLYPQLSVAPVVIADRAGLPVVQTLHDYELISASFLDPSGGVIDHDEETPAFRALNSATLPLRRFVHVPRIRRFVACSGFLAKRYAEHEIDSTVLPYFVEPVNESDIPGFSGREGVAFVGRLHESKGVLDVLELARLAPDIPVTIAGYGPLDTVVERAAESLPNLRFAGFAARPQVIELFRQARVALMPSRWQEPGGISALEAMSVGTPVVAYRNGGLADYVEGIAGGRVTDPEVGALLKSCRTLYDDPRSWETASRSAVEGIRNRHSPHTYTEQILEIYEAALSG